MQPCKQKSKGFTLIELLVVIAIISLLLGIAIPKYTAYSQKAKFLEVIMATTPYKLAAEIAVQTQGIVTVEELNAGDNSIPNELISPNQKYVESVTMLAGVITSQSKNIVSEEQSSPNYKLVATIDNGSIIWSVADDSSCLIFNLCTK